jgi:WASH complex subunit strumpellin
LPASPSACAPLAAQNLLEIEDEFHENMNEILERFYNLYQNVFKYISDFNRFLDDLTSGYFIQYTVDGLLLDTDGKQLVVEAFYLLGVMLLQLDQRIPGPAREKMIIAYYRAKGESTMTNVDEVCKLCRSTGYIPARFNRANPGHPDVPNHYPERYFARFPINRDVCRLVIGKLQSDDVYLQTIAFPSPEHRSTRLANQASMVYVILYFCPDILKSDMASMREIVDKHFNDNFVITQYMGVIVDLSIEWERYPAARAALSNTLQPQNVMNVYQQKQAQVSASLQELRHYLTEGVLTEQYVLDHIAPLLHCMRKANVTLRWLLLHRRMRGDGHFAQFRKAVVHAPTKKEEEAKVDTLIQLLLNTAQLEFQLKKTFSTLLDTKAARWEKAQTACAGRMNELAQYFSGQQALTRVERDDHLMKWFTIMAQQVSALSFTDATLAGRKIQQLTSALEEVEQFDQIDTSLQIKQFLSDSREELTQMVRKSERVSSDGSR